MKVELIAVIEISNYEQDIKCPEFGPFWEHEDDWQKHNQQCNMSAGFSENMKAYLKGSALYEIRKISDNDLLKAIEKEIILQQTDKNDGIDDLQCAFSGGYILRVDDKDIYFPQCCGDLADIKEWENLVTGKTHIFYVGHPFPRITEKENHILFDFINIEIRENFAPPVPVEAIEIAKSDLEIAIAQVQDELRIFASRLNSINHAMNLNITNIDKRLIFGTTE